MQVYLVDGYQYNISHGTGISSSAAQILFSANLAVCVLQSSATATYGWAAHLHFSNGSLALLIVIAEPQGSGWGFKCVVDHCLVKAWWRSHPACTVMI